MARSIWNGTITFGLVAVPIKLYSATESKTVSFHEVHERDGARIEHRRFCSKEDKEVDFKDVVRGYEVAQDEYVVLSKEELAGADPGGGKVIALEDFVSAHEIDPVFYDRTYYVGPGKQGEAPYRLVLAALERSERVGIGRFVFHGKEQLVALRPLEHGLLALNTMRFADEVVSGSELDIPHPQKKPRRREVDMAEALVDSLHGPFRPESYSDTYRDSVMKLIRSKAKGREIEVPERHDPELSPDLLMAALEASVRPRRGSGAAA